MKWFGRKAGRVAARPFLLRGWSASQGELWPKSYEAQVREAFLGNPVAQRAVRLVAEGVASASIYVLREERDGGPPPPASPVPLPVPGRIVTAALLETVASQLLLHGNAYLQILTDAEGEPAELFALRPERVSVEADASGWPAAYVYRAGEAKTRLAARTGSGGLRSCI